MGYFSEDIINIALVETKVEKKGNFNLKKKGGKNKIWSEYPKVLNLIQVYNIKIKHLRKQKSIENCNYETVWEK